MNNGVYVLAAWLNVAVSGCFTSRPHCNDFGLQDLELRGLRGLSGPQKYVKLSGCL